MTKKFSNALTEEIDRLREENKALKEENSRLKAQLIERSQEKINRLTAEVLSLLFSPATRN